MANTENKGHPVGEGVGAAGGAVTGLAVGASVGSPIGAVVGAAVGAVAGGVAGHGVAAAVNPTVEHQVLEHPLSVAPLRKERGEVRRVSGRLPLRLGVSRQVDLDVGRGRWRHRAGMGQG